MEEVQGSKRKRVYSLEPNTILRASFPWKYVNHLLPALLEIPSNRSNDENESREIEKIVRLQVDMALVMSADGFGWSHALKRKLLRSSTNVNPTCSSSILMYKHNPHCSIGKNLSDLQPSLNLPSTAVSVHSHKKRNPKPELHSSSLEKRANRIYRHRLNEKRTDTRDEDANLGLHLMTLRRILPGGDEMGTHELLSEVESYIVCLELQVSILRTLVNEHSSDMG